MTLKHLVYQLVRESIDPGSAGLNAFSSETAGGTNAAADASLTDNDWNEVYQEMKAQSIETLPQRWLQNNVLPDEELRRKWLRRCILAQTKWIMRMNRQDSLLKLLEKEKIDCVILKGAAAAMAYPQPTLRKCGDVDFLVKQADFERAAAVLEKNGYELEHEKDLKSHHYGYIKDGIHYELHWRLGSVWKGNQELIEFFEKGIDKREYARIEDFSFPVFPVDLNGLVLMFHINQHLRSGLGLRHFIDWMMYLRKNDNLSRLLPILRKTGMERLALTVTAACQEYLGLQKMVKDPQQYPCEELMDYVWEKGNFGHKSGEDGKISFVLMRVTNPVRLLQRLQEGGRVRWKATSKYRFLRPFAWLYQSGRIMTEIVAYRITPRKIRERKKASVRERKLIHELGLEIDHWIKTEL